MGKTMTADSHRSPAAKVMDEAIELALEGRSPFPERAAFIDADTPSTGHDIERAADEGLSVVLVCRRQYPGPQTRTRDELIVTRKYLPHFGRIAAAIPLHPADGIRPFKAPKVAGATHWTHSRLPLCSRRRSRAPQSQGMPSTG
jgi:hypothetical protein